MISIFHSKMGPIAKIKTVIIDQDEEFLFSLKEYLSFFPEVELRGMASQQKKAKKLLINEKPDLIFLDPEAVGLVDELRLAGQNGFHVVFCATDERFLIRALHESALDFFLKPVNPTDLKEAIERYKERKKNIFPSTFSAFEPAGVQVVSLPTFTGLQFLNTRDVVLFQCNRETEQDKPCWEALLTNFKQVKLRKSTTAREIAGYMGKSRFVQINQSVIVNLLFLEQVEYKTRTCKLVSPYHKIRLTVSRTHLADLRDRFDLL